MASEHHGVKTMGKIGWRSNMLADLVGVFAGCTRSFSALDKQREQVHEANLSGIHISYDSWLLQDLQSVDV